MNIFLVNQDHTDGTSLMHKLAFEAKDGAIIGLTDGEMSLYQSPDFSWLNIDSKNSNIIEVEANKRYVFIVDGTNTVINDVLKLDEVIGIRVGIVRVREG